MSRVTADTITSEQIRALRTELQYVVRTEKHDELRREEARADADTCTVALTDRRSMAYMMAGVAEGVRKARERCAQILNDRESSEP